MHGVCTFERPEVEGLVARVLEGDGAAVLQPPHKLQQLGQRRAAHLPEVRPQGVVRRVVCKGW